jgi:photosystem II stability/assembly factor-like uncharacterized protein
MNKLIILSVLLLSVRTSKAQWTLVPSGTTKDLHDVHFPSPNIGYCAGDSGIVIKSTNGGAAWQTVFSDASKSFTSIYFTDNNTGYAASGTIYKTTNGGVNWTQILSDSLNMLEEVYFINSTTGFAGGYGKVYKTVNAGATWSIFINAPGIFNSIHFPTPMVGYFIGGPGYNDPLFKTTDGGITYLQIGNQQQSIKESVQFINDSIGYMCGWYGPMIAKTTNGGMTWKLLDTVNWPDCWDVHFINEMNGYYVSYDVSTTGSNIRKTVNGGISWTTDLNSPTKLLEFFFTDQYNAVAVGRKGAVYRMHINTTGISETTGKDRNFYPNPVRGLITLEGFENEKHIEITDLAGRIINRFKIINHKVDLSSLPRGMYYIKTTDDLWVKKIILE